MTVCPICEYPSCDELIIDLLMCNGCNHIFKKEIIAFSMGDVDLQLSNHLHRYDDPVKILQKISDSMNKEERTFFFPSMNFYALEIEPSKFYKEEYNHYFNQMSLMVLLTRAGLIPVIQTNVWSGNICATTITVRKNI